MPFGGLLIAGAGAVGGFFAGIEDDVTTKRLNLAGATDIERTAGQITLEQLQGLPGLVQAGPGQQDVQAALTSRRGLGGEFQGFAGRQRGFADVLRGLGQTGFAPTEQDITRTRGISEQLFAPQQVALRQSFQQQQTQANIEATRLGRGINDPILRAKLAQQQTQAQERLQAQIGSTAQGLALQAPRERLGFQQQALGVEGQRLQTLGARSDIQQGLATQALQNRLTLAGLGQQIGGQERQFRQVEAGTTVTAEGSFGKGLAGALGGFGGGATAGASLAGAFGGGGGGPSPLSLPSSGGRFFGGNSFEFAGIEQGSSLVNAQTISPGFVGR